MKQAKSRNIPVLIILLIAVFTLSGCYPACDDLKPPPRPAALIDQVEVEGGLLASLPDGGVLVAGCDRLWFYGQDLELRAEAAPFSEADVCMKDLAVSGEGDIYVAGSVHESSSDDLDAFVARLTPAGEVVWARQFGSESNDEALALDLSADGVVIGGYTNFELPGEASHGGRDFFVVNYGAGGELLALKQLGTSARDGLSGVVVLDGAVYAIGVSEGDLPGGEDVESKERAFVARLNDGLEPVWWWSAAASRAYAEGDWGPVAAAADGGVILTYVEDSNTSTALLELSPDGVPLWQGRIGTTGEDDPADVLFLPGEGIFVLGETYGAFPGYREPVCGFPIESLSRYTDAFLLKTDPEGKTVAAVQFGGIEYDKGVSLAAGPGWLYLTYWKSGDAFDQKPVLYLARFDTQKL